MSTKKKLILLWHDAGGFLEVHKAKDPLLFPLYLSREYAIPYEIVALNSENKTVREPLPGGGTLLRLANKRGLGKHFGYVNTSAVFFSPFFYSYEAVFFCFASYCSRKIEGDQPPSLNVQTLFRL